MCFFVVVAAHCKLAMKFVAVCWHTLCPVTPGQLGSTFTLQFMVRFKISEFSKTAYAAGFVVLIRIRLNSEHIQMWIVFIYTF